jgi:hypothetical protein
MKIHSKHWVIGLGLFMAALCTCVAHAAPATPPSGETDVVLGISGSEVLREGMQELTGVLLADTTDKRVVVTRNDGVQYVGVILSDDGREVLLETELMGKVYIPKADIQSIRPVERVQDVQGGEFVGAGAFTTRYAFTTNALPVKKGENYAMLNLYGPEVHFAVSDNTSLGVMSTWIGSPMALAVKRSFATRNPLLNFSVGGLFGTSGYLNSFEGYGGLYFGNVTYGNRTHNVTLAVGYAHVSSGKSEEWLVPSGTYYGFYPKFDALYEPYTEVRFEDHQYRAWGPMFAIGAVTKVGPKASLVFDSMWGMFRSNNRYNVAEIKPLTNSPYPYQYDVTLVDGDDEPVFILMPGFRVERTENKAFQFNLAGVSFTNEGDRISFPFPMCTWFYGF